MFLPVGNWQVLYLGTCSYPWQHVPANRNHYQRFIGC
jgi:hypothetical protein